MGKFDDISLKPEDFGARVSTHTVLTGPQLKRLFPSKEEKQAFLDLLKVVDASTSDNKKKAKLITDIDKYAGVVLKLVKKAALGL